MQIARASEGTFERGDADRVVGEVWLRSSVAASEGLSVGIVHFGPRTRTHWHPHPGGQFLFGASGRGRVRSRDGEAFELAPGDVIHTPAGEWHFHRGSPDAPVVRLTENGGGSPEWVEPVRQEEYEPAFRSAAAPLPECCLSRIGPATSEAATSVRVNGSYAVAVGRFECSPMV